MDPETEKIIKEQMEKLPIEVRKLFTDPELGDKIINIGKKNGFNIEQLGIFQLETYLVMLGLVHPDDYRDELKNRLNIDDGKANIIITDINEQMFSKIREKLQEAYENTNTDDKENPETQILESSSPETEEEKKNDAQILSSHGIEILPARNASGIADAGGNGNEKRETLPVPDLPAAPGTQLPQAGKLELESPPRLVEEGIRGGDSGNNHLAFGTPPPKGGEEQLHPTLAQKLSGSFKIPSVKTEHSLDNITKTSPSTPTNPKADKPYMDPYREIPE